jgi:hypothetical protein
MTENVDGLLEELRRKNVEKRRQALLKDKAVADVTGRAEFVKGDTGSISGEETVKLLVAGAYNDLHEVASRIKGKK